MEVKINSKEIAEAIAAKVEQVTGHDCEAFTNETGSVVVYHRTQVIAQITPLFSVMDVTPVGGLFDGETVCIPLKAETICGLRELTTTYDEAAMRVISAAVKH